MRIRFRCVAVIMFLLLGLAQPGLSQQSTLDQASADVLKVKLVATLSAATGTTIQIVSINSTPLAGLYEVELGTGETLFSDAQGGYLVTGDMFQTADDGLVNLTAAARQVKIASWVAAVPEDQMIIFSPEETKATITVFTDVDCTYCRKLHSEMASILDLGIRVRYVAYPRGGEASTAYPKMISVWCSDDRNKSFTQAKNGQNIPSRECDNHVLEHYNLGNKIGISGTPALVLQDGTVIPGYLDPAQLAGVVFGQ